MVFFSGIPLLLYGLSAVCMISYKEIVKTSEGDVYVYFLLKEDKGSLHWIILERIICNIWLE